MNAIDQNYSFSAPSAVRNITAESVTSDSVTLTWNLPASYCKIVNSFLSYSGSVLWKEEVDSMSYQLDYGLITETVVKNLTPYTNYTFCVVANNDMGNGTEECLQDVVTLEGSELIYISCETLIK